MKYNQNHRISQVTEITLIIGVDIAKKEHYARGFDFRGIEYGKHLKFKASSSGFDSFIGWVRNLQKETDKGGYFSAVISES